MYSLSSIRMVIEIIHEEASFILSCSQFSITSHHSSHCWANYASGCTTDYLSPYTLGSFSNDDGDGSENVTKAKDLISTTTTLHVHHAFLYISLRSLHEATTWKSLISRFMEQVTSDNEFFLLFQNLSVVPKKLTPGKFSYIWHFQEIGMSATKFEKGRIHFKSDVFATVAVVNAKARYCQF